MRISLEINGVSFELNSHVDRSQLTGAGFKKVGIFARLFLPIQKKPGDIIYFSKNPSINVFNDAVQVVANLDASMGADMMNGTSCYAIINGDRLRYIICQVIQSNVAAYQFAHDVREAALKEIGEPTGTDEPKIWKDGGQTFASEIGPGGSNAFIHWSIE